MRSQAWRRIGAATAFWAALLLAAPAHSQYREYYVQGRVVDSAKKPIPEVEIRLRDVATSRSYHVRTGKDGAFKLAGLPHGVYEVAFAREGYAPKQDEWKFEAPQETMQKVEVPDVVLASMARLREVERLKEAESGVKQAAEKIRQGDFDGAVRLLQGLLAKNPEDANALFFLGLSYARKKMYREALEPLTRVTELNPAFPRAYFEIGVCQRQLGDLPKALAAYDRNLQLEPGNADGAYNAGLILFETGRVDEASVLFERGLASRPQDPELLEMMGRCSLHNVKLEEAVAYLEKARAASTDAGKIGFLDELIRTVRAQLSGAKLSGR